MGARAAHPRAAGLPVAAPTGALDPDRRDDVDRDEAEDGDRIVTPEAIVLELETAGVASRVCAGLIDLAIQLGALLVGSILIGVISLSIGTDGNSFFTTAYAILVTIVLLGYPVLFETLWRGRTIGKRAIGLRAVTIEGAPIRLRHAMLRMMGGLVDRLIPPGGVTGALFVLGTRRRQRVGDLLAGTVVIRDPERTALPAAMWFPVPYGYEAYAGWLDPSSVTVDQYTVVRGFLLRMTELKPAARAAVATDLADRISLVIRHQRPTTVAPETFLLCVIARYQRRNFPTYQPAAWQGSVP